MNPNLFLFIYLPFCIHITLFPLMVSIGGRDGVTVRRIFWSSIGVCKWIKAQQSQPKDRGYIKCISQKTLLDVLPQPPFICVKHVCQNLFVLLFSVASNALHVSDVDNVIKRHDTRVFLLEGRMTAGKSEVLKWSLSEQAKNCEA